jgi:tRNA U34 2-thiouridine synthase MnmA/TrmU
MKAKAIALLSGGLDSTLATFLVKEQRIELEAINFITVFCNCTSKNSTCLSSQKAANQMGVKLKVFNITEEYLRVIKKPKYGYGKNMNPCIDCRIFMFKIAKQYMQETGAGFIVTGEVLGERPMSQRMDAIKIIERESGLGGLILRPLSARLFPPTVPEKAGIIDRKKLLSLSGRSRKPQLRLAKEIGINDYPCPSGGCLLTDQNFSIRLKDLMTHDNLNVENAQLLKIGRHFRLSKTARLIVGRNDGENKTLASFFRNSDIILRCENFAGSTALLKGDINDEIINLSAMITTYFSKGKQEEKVSVLYANYGCSDEFIIKVKPIERDRLSVYKIGG